MGKRNKREEMVMYWVEDRVRKGGGEGEGLSSMTWCLKKSLEDPSFSNRNKVYISKMKAKRKADFNNVVSVPQTKVALIPAHWPHVRIHEKCQQLLSLRVWTVYSGFK